MNTPHQDHDQLPSRPAIDRELLADALAAAAFLAEHDAEITAEAATRVIDGRARRPVSINDVRDHLRALQGLDILLGDDATPEASAEWLLGPTSRWAFMRSGAASRVDFVMGGQAPAEPPSRVVSHSLVTALENLFAVTKASREVEGAVRLLVLAVLGEAGKAPEAIGTEREFFEAARRVAGQPPKAVPSQDESDRAIGAEVRRLAAGSVEEVRLNALVALGGTATTNQIDGARYLILHLAAVGARAVEV